MATAEFLGAERDLSFEVDRMTEHDLLEVVEIEESSGLSPWGWDAYHKELQTPDECLMLVARLSPHHQRAIAGFVVSRLIDGELHVYNVAVRQDFRRRGIAVQLIQAALDWGLRKCAQAAFLEVREGNSAAQSLYARCGFQVTGRRRDYYSKPAEDALLMTVSLEPQP